MKEAIVEIEEWKEALAAMPAGDASQWTREELVEFLPKLMELEARLRAYRRRLEAAAVEEAAAMLLAIHAGTAGVQGRGDD